MNIQIVIGIIVIIAFILMLIVIAHNKFNFAAIKIDEAESNIEIYLDRKKDLLDRARPIIKKELKLDDFLEELDNYDKDKLNHFEMNNLLTDCYNSFIKKVDENDKLLKSEAIVNIISDLNDNDASRVGTIKYYNDSVVTFNKLVKSFPTNIFALFTRYKEKDFYNDEKKEIYEILNQSKKEEKEEEK